MKTPISLNIEDQAIDALRRALAQVSVIERSDVRLEASSSAPNVKNVLADIDVFGRRHTLICRIASNGQPRHVRTALLELRHHANEGRWTVPLVIAPYLSPEARALCLEYNSGYLDLQGNARLVFDGVFIERDVAAKPAVERRELRSLFKPKSARVLRALLRDPRREWRVSELSATTEVSLGHISNVRANLLDREWASVTRDGLLLSDPDALLNAWREAYVPPTGKRAGFYTTLHGASFENKVRNMQDEPGPTGRTLLSSFSAAQWLAPYGRTGTQYFYADEAGLERLRSVLKLSVSAKGENVVVTLPDDPGLFLDAVEPAPGVFTTSLVQTYLDLAAAGERGRESAEHLRGERLTWSN